MKALPISTRTVIERDGSTHTLLVVCPQEAQTVSVERCVACPGCQCLDDGDGSVRRPSVACSSGTPEVPGGARTAGNTLSRFSTCVRADAIGQVVLPSPYGCLPVVDENTLLVGVLGTDSHARIDRAAVDLAVEEHLPIRAALAHMAHHRARHVPVVARDGLVVGVLDDLEAMRALRHETRE